MVIGIKEEKITEYSKLHADNNQGVRDLLEKAHMTNFSIFIKKMDDGKHYLFTYYEYTGEDYEADMAKLASEQRHIDWLSMCDPMQLPLEGEHSWTIMDSVYYNR